MQEYPKISIITPNYNQGAYLEETILSVVGQNYPNLEYIVIDGGSTDNSIDIIKKYSDQITYWESTPDKGMYDAIQKGFNKSTGEIMAWINSDDMYLPKSLFSVAEIFTSFKEVNWLLGFPVFYDSYGRLVECAHSFRQWSKYDFYIGHFKWIQQESVFWRRTLWEKAGNCINTGLKYAGDFDLWNKFFLHDKLYVTTALLSGFRKRDGEQLSMSQSDVYEQEVKSVLATNTYSDEEKRIIRGFQNAERNASRLSKLYFFKSNALVTKYKLDNFDYPPVILFDRKKQHFTIG